MADKAWDEQLKGFLQRAGEDLKRMGQDLRTEAQRLVEQVQDPRKQALMREKAREIGHWAKQTASDVAELVEEGAKKAEAAFRTISETRPPTPPPAAAPAREQKTAARPATPKKAAKTVGPKKRPAGGAPKKKSSSGTAAKKTVGRKPRPI